MNLISWASRSLVYRGDGLCKYLMSHAANPLPLSLGDGQHYRVFYSGRDARNRSSVGAVDINIITREVVQIHKQAQFTFGVDDSFFSDGVSIGNTYSVDGKMYMLFMGWKNPTDAHWSGRIGRLLVNSDFSLELDSSEPFMNLDAQDNVSLSYPWVLHHQDIYKMWYGSTQCWDAGNGEMLHVIKYAESRDGLSWTKKGTSIPYEIGLAQAFSRPTVYIDDSGVYHMWYSFRGNAIQKYKIGYATSSDGISWNRHDDFCVFSDAAQSWDCDMQEYPFVMQHDQTLYMFYNGNNYGESGFGLAESSLVGGN
jgi:hypothetical protein